MIWVIAGIVALMAVIEIGSELLWPLKDWTGPR